MLQSLRKSFSLLIVGFAAAVAANAASDASQRRFSVRDSIEMSNFSEPGLLSPDGHWFAIVTQRGLIAQDATEATIWLFDSSGLRKSAISSGAVESITPIALTRLTASINGGGEDIGKVIMSVTWETGSNSLLFLGRDGQENRQLFRVDVRKRSATALTMRTQDVVEYAETGSTIVYLAGPNVVSARLWSSTDSAAPDVVIGTGQPLEDLLYPNFRLNVRFMPTEFEIWRIDGSGSPPRPVIDAHNDRPMRVLGSYYPGAVGLSADASRAVMVVHAERIPPAWERYEAPGGLAGERFHADPPTTDGSDVPLERRESEYDRARQYVLVDLQRGTTQPLLAAPAADFLRGLVDQYQAAWSPDGRYVAVSGTFLPFDPPPANGVSTRPCGAAVVRIEGGKVDCLVDHRNPKAAPVTGLSWISGQRLLVDFAGAQKEEVYELRRSGWHSTERRSEVSAPLKFTVREDLNHPPVLHAEDPHTGRDLQIFDPNPQLRSIDLGVVSTYSWKLPGGQTVQGGLAKPPDFSTARRYPLVIQTHGFRSDRFFNTGLPSFTSVAGRALAGRGMFVLQVHEPHYDSDGTWREAEQRGTRVYLAAIDQLASEGLVDPTKVGLTGYSRTGPFVIDSLENAPDRFAAAVVANTASGSPFEYYTFVDEGFPGKAANFADFVAGARPYGEGLQKWFDRSPGFRTDRIKAPVLIAAGNPGHLIALWSLYAPLRDQGKPVELQYIRSGEHNLTKPVQVLAHDGMIVDWFDFWLNGHKDPDPVKASQYTRWESLRALGHAPQPTITNLPTR